MLRHILFSVILVCLPLSSASIWAEECAGENFTLSINGTQIALSSSQQKSVAAFLSEQIAQSGNAIKFTSAVQPTRRERNSMLIGLSPEGLKRVKSIVGDAGLNASQAPQMAVDCSCSDPGRTCWLETDSKDNSVTCMGASCCSMKMEINGVSYKS